MNKILRACIKLGFNRDTGCSPWINVTELERIVGGEWRANGNGFKLRRDCKPWSLLGMEKEKDGNLITSFRFTGYLTPEQEARRVQSRLDNIERRMKGEQIKCREHLARLAQLEHGVPMYSFADIRR